MPHWEMYVFSPWIEAPDLQPYDDAGNPLPKIKQRRRYPQITVDYPTIDTCDDDTGQPHNRIMPNPNLCLWHITCRGVVRQAINADTRYAVLAQRQVWDRWFQCTVGLEYLGYDDKDVVPSGCPVHSDPVNGVDAVIVPVGLDSVPWRVSRANRQALRTWLMAKGMTGAQARAIVQDAVDGDLDAKEIRQLSKAYLATLPVAVQVEP